MPLLKPMSDPCPPPFLKLRHTWDTKENKPGSHSSADLWHHRKWNDWNDWNSWSDTAMVVASEEQLRVIQDSPKANRRKDATLLRNGDLAEAGMNQRSAPSVFSELVKACEQVDKEYEGFTGIAVTHGHFSSRAISVQDARKAVRRSCRQRPPLSFKRVLRAMCCRCSAEWHLDKLHETSRKAVVW